MRQATWPPRWIDPQRGSRPGRATPNHEVAMDIDRDKYAQIERLSGALDRLGLNE